MGLKGAAGSGKAADARTTANAVSEDRSEAPDRSQPGLSGCLYPQSLSCLPTQYLETPPKGL
jgi:hypothetical protein